MEVKILLCTSFAGGGKLLARNLQIPESSVVSHELPSKIMDAYHEQRFDVILIAGQLGMGFSGTHVLKDLLHSECTTPIVAISSDPVMNLALQHTGLQYNRNIMAINGYLENTEELKATIETVLSRR